MLTLKDVPNRWIEADSWGRSEMLRHVPELSNFAFLG